MHIKKFSPWLCVAGILFFTQRSLSVSYLSEYLKFKSEEKFEKASEVLNNWKPTSFEEESYKKFA